MEKIRVTKRSREDLSPEQENSPPNEVIEYDTYPCTNSLVGNHYLNIYMNSKPRPGGFSSTVYHKTGRCETPVLNIGQ